MNNNSCKNSSHWLLNSIYGRQLLKEKLRTERPDLHVRALFDAPQHEALLDAMIDVLDLRCWSRPRGLAEKVAAVRRMLQMTLDISETRASALTDA